MAKLFNRRRSSGLVGLDIEDHTIAAAEVAPHRSRLRVAAVSPLPAGLVKDGEFVDPAGLSSELESFFRSNDLSRRVRLGLANSRVVVRVVDLPAIEDRRELDAAVRFQAVEQLPMPLEEAVIDYQVVGKSVDQQGVEHKRVVLVAAPRLMAESAVIVCRKAGLKLVGIDLSAFALIRALYVESADKNGAATDSSEKSSGDQETVAYCHVGAVTSLALADGPSCLFARTTPYGISSMVQEIAGQDFSDLAAKDLLFGRDFEAADKSGELRAAALQSALEHGAQQIAHELQVALDYYGSLPSSPEVSRAVITGPGLLIEGFVDQIAELSPVPIKSAEPQLENLGSVEPVSAALAYGLALDGVVA